MSTKANTVTINRTQARLATLMNDCRSGIVFVLEQGNINSIFGVQMASFMEALKFALLHPTEAQELVDLAEKGQPEEVLRASMENVKQLYDLWFAGETLVVDLSDFAIPEDFYHYFNATSKAN